MHSESNSSAVDVETMRTRIWAIVRQAVGVFALSLEFTRDNSWLCGADIMKHLKIVVLAYSLALTARTTSTRSRIVAVRRRKGAALPTLELVRVISFLRARELGI